MNRRILLAAALSCAALPAGAQSALPSVSVKEAHERAKSGKSILVDIRRPEEWKDTGVPEGAVMLDMTAPTFLAKLSALKLDHPGKTIEIICRTANRTQRVQEILFQRGWREIVNVRGGILGNPGNPGWLAEALPIARVR
jgi:rhodanese-related sulfurtransferase